MSSLVPRPQGGLGTRLYYKVCQPVGHNASDCLCPTELAGLLAPFYVLTYIRIIR